MSLNRHEGHYAPSYRCWALMGVQEKREGWCQGGSLFSLWFLSGWRHLNKCPPDTQTARLTFSSSPPCSDTRTPVTPSARSGRCKGGDQPTRWPPLHPTTKGWNLVTRSVTLLSHYTSTRKHRRGFTPPPPQLWSSFNCRSDWLEMSREVFHQLLRWQIKS